MSRPDVTVTPTDWMAQGDARVPGEPRDLVVWQGIPGERAQVRVYHVGHHVSRGRFIRPAGPPHPLRRAPPCPRCGPCGGCPLMHLVPEGQDRARLALVRAAFAEHDLLAFVPPSIFPSPDGDVDFRHTVKVACDLDEQGSIRVGAYARDSHEVVPIRECIVATPTLRATMSALAHHARRLELRPYDPRTGHGLLRYAVLRQSRTSGEVLVTLVAGHKHPLLGELADALGRELDAIVGVQLHVNRSEGNNIVELPDGILEDGRPPWRRLLGQDTIEEQLCGVRLKVGPVDFFQTNPAMAAVLVQDVVDAFGDQRHRPVVDLFCGVGAFTLPLAREHGWAIGVEANPAAVMRARQNAALNGLSAEFSAGAAGAVLPEVARRLAGRAPVVCVDPARKGLDVDTVQGIAALRPAAVAYVSCNGAALARDLGHLQRAGFRVEYVRAYDMFPQTPHLELMALLRPVEPPADVGVRAPRRKVLRGG
jgi:23S rRNA (uracil1939-C5)-methyltransferase